MDRVIDMDQDLAEHTMRRLAREEGIFCGYPPAAPWPAPCGSPNSWKTRSSWPSSATGATVTCPPASLTRRPAHERSGVRHRDHPDLDGGRRLYDLHGLDDKDTASALFNLRRQENGSEFLRLHLHRVVAISVVLRSTQGIKVWSLGDEDADEKELIERFYDGIERFTPQIVSWNGGGFDLPVLNYRALKHGVVARRFWETGNEDTSFRFNNYLSRFHQRHLDLMEQLAMFNNRANAPLDQIATLLGFPARWA